MERSARILRAVAAVARALRVWTKIGDEVDMQSIGRKYRRAVMRPASLCGCYP